MKGTGATNICTTMRRWIAALILAVGLVVLSQHSMAAVVSWDGGGNGTSWHDPMNWSGNAVPGRTDDVLITLAGSYTVSVDAPALAASLTVGAGNGDQTLSLVTLGTLSVGGSATVDTGGTLDLAEGLLIGGTLDIAVDAAVIVNDAGGVCCIAVLDVTAGIVNNGTMLLDGTAVAATVAAGGGLTNGTTGSIEFQGDASIGGTLVNNAGGLVAGIGGICCHAVLNVAGTFTNNGLVELTSDFAQNAGITVTGGALTNGSNGTISILSGAGGARFITGQIVNQSGGLVTIDADLLLDGVGAQHSNLGMISMGLGNVTVTGATSFGNTGLINIGAGRLLNIIDGSFDPTSGSIVGDGGVGVNQVINWTGGTLGGDLTTQAAGGLNISGAGDKRMSGNHVLNNDGLATWNGTGQIRFFGLGSPIFNNNGEFQVQGFDQTFVESFGSIGTFNNPPGATFRKLAGTGLTNIRLVAFISGGDVLVEGGTLRLEVGEITGMLDISAGATVLFENSSGIPYVLQGATVDGQGTVSVIGNRTEVLEPVDMFWPHLIVAGIIDFQGDTTLPSLHFSGGANLIGPATITVDGPMLWEQGGPRGSGVLDFDPTNPADTMLITGVSNSVIEGSHVVNNFGTAIWDMGEFRLLAGGTFNNHGTFEVEVFDGSLAGPFFGGTFNNFGTFHKLPGTGPLLIWTPFNNSGLVELADGVTELSVSSTHTGDFDVASGAILWFSASNPSVLEPGSTIDGEGTVRITGSLIATADPLWPNLELNGTLTLDGDTTVPSLSLGTGPPGASLQGAATLTVDGPMLWVSGGVQNSGTLDFAPSNPSDTMVLTGPTDKIMASGGVVNNFGTLQWQEGDIGTSAGGTLNNHGTLEVQGVDLVFSGVFGLGSLNNLGSFIKLPGTGTTTFAGTAFTNGGLVDLQGGTLVIQPTLAASTYRQTAGETRLSGGDLLADLNFPLVFEGGRLTGEGMVTAEVSNVAATVAPGLSAGTLQIGADYTQEFSARLEIQLGGLIPGDQHDVLAVTGIATLGGELNVVPINGFLPQVGEDFVVVTAGTVMGEFDEVTGPGEYTVAYNANNVTITVSVAPLPCPWDCDSAESTDGTVGIVDFLTLLSQWGGPGSCDFDGGGVGIVDFLALLGNWGACP